MKKILPTFIYPTEVMDGAIIMVIVSPFVIKSHLYPPNNPVVHELYNGTARILILSVW